MIFHLAWRRTLAGAVMCGAGASGTSAQASLPPSLELRVPKAPTLGSAEGGSLLVHELHVTNSSGQPMTLKSVDGNTGNSTEPHLHFHVSDGTSPLGSEGMPYGLDSFEIVGHRKTFNIGCTRETPKVRRGEVPLENVLVRFP